MCVADVDKQRLLWSVKSFIIGWIDGPVRAIYKYIIIGQYRETGESSLLYYFQATEVILWHCREWG